MLVFGGVIYVANFVGIQLFNLGLFLLGSSAPAFTLHQNHLLFRMMMSMQECEFAVRFYNNCVSSLLVCPGQ